MRIARLALPDGRESFVELGDGGGWVLSDAPWRGGARTGEWLSGLDGEANGSHRRLAPVAPSKVVCVGRNYRAHAAELGHEVPAEPLLFLKPPSALLAPGGSIELPPKELSARVEHEVELGVVIGQRVRRASRAEAAAAIWGSTVVGDITARDLQRRDRLWTRAKGFDTFCPVGPVVVAGLDTSDLTITCEVGGELRQSGSTADMVFDPPALVAFISQVMTLEPGDLVATGTPAGVGPLCAGDTLTMRVSGIGALRARVVASGVAG